MSVTTVTPSTGNPTAVEAGEARQEPRIANTWLRRLRRKVRGWVGPAQPAADGWAPAGGPVMVIAPHPDDEVIGCGGTVIRHERGGDPVSIIYLTRGERSRGFPWLSAAQKQARRMKEALCSCSILGVTDTLFLDGVDGNLSDARIMSELSAKVAQAVLSRRPKVIYVPHAGDNHPDHIAAYRMIARIAAEISPQPTVLQYELWSPLAADFAVDISRQMRAKLRAIRRHQLALDAFDYVPTMIGLAAYRSGTMLQRKGYAEAFKRG